MNKEDDVEVTLYYLIDPITNDVRYIGRTKNTLSRRLNGHLSKARKGNKSHKNDCLKFLGKTSSSYIHTYLNKDIICQNKYKIKSTNE